MAFDINSFMGGGENPFAVDQSLMSTPTQKTGGGLDANALFSLALAGQSLMNYGKDTSKPVDLATPLSSYISNINKAKMLNRQQTKDDQMISMMKYALDPSNPGKLKLGPTGVDISYDPNHPIVKDFLGGVGTPTKPEQFKTDDSLKLNTPSSGGGSFVGSPFGSSDQQNTDISPGDLAGLTTADITAILGAKNMQEQLRQQSYRNVVESLINIPYKRALTRQSEATTLENTPSVPITVGGTTMVVTPKDAIAWARLSKETQATKAKEYEFAKSPEGGSYKGSFIDFMNAEDTVGIKDFREAKKTGYGGTSYYDYKIKMAEAGAPKLGPAIEKQKALDQLKREAEVQDPGFISKVQSEINKRVGKIELSDPTGTADVMKRYKVSREVAVKAINDKRLFDEIELRIKQAYGDGVTYVKGEGFKKDGKLIVRY